VDFKYLTKSLLNVLFFLNCLCKFLLAQFNPLVIVTDKLAFEDALLIFFVQFEVTAVEVKCCCEYVIRFICVPVRIFRSCTAQLFLYVKDVAFK
jgi:hypothetical protein